MSVVSVMNSQSPRPSYNENEYHAQRPNTKPKPQLLACNAVMYENKRSTQFIYFFPDSHTSVVLAFDFRLDSQHDGGIGGSRYSSVGPNAASMCNLVRWQVSSSAQTPKQASRSITRQISRSASKTPMKSSTAPTLVANIRLCSVKACPTGVSFW